MIFRSMRQQPLGGAECGDVRSGSKPAAQLRMQHTQAGDAQIETAILLRQTERQPAEFPDLFPELPGKVILAIDKAMQLTAIAFVLKHIGDILPKGLGLMILVAHNCISLFNNPCLSTELLLVFQP